MAYQIPMDYLMLKFDLIVNVWFGLFNGISILYGLFKAEIWINCKCLVWFILMAYQLHMGYSKLKFD